MKGDATLPRVVVVLVNYKGWRDTIECLESLLRTSHANMQVVVCDNGSGDDSLAAIEAWARGERSASGALEHLVTPAIAKPLPLACLSRFEAEAGGGPASRSAPLVLVDTGANLGFAGGCNVGIRYAMKQPDCAFVWLLNNDTVVEPDALSALVRRCGQDTAIGICGSLLLFYDEPGTVQAAGGARYNPVTTRAEHVGGLLPRSDVPPDHEVERATDYVVGASMLVTRAFVETVGLMEEDYFLYFEELDWTRRAAGRFRLAFARDSIVYHKEGRTIGSNSVAASKSPLADFYLARNRVRIARRYYPMLLPLTFVVTLAAMVNRLRRRQWQRVSLVARAALGMPEPSWLRGRR